MDGTTKKLIQLLEQGNLELRMAAMNVVTELGIGGPAVTRSLGRALREEPRPLRLLALRGLARLGAREVIHQVLPLLEMPGELQEQSLDVVVKVGDAAVEPLKRQFSQSSFHGKQAIATALARIATSSAFAFLLAQLHQEPFEIQKHLSQCLCDALDRLPRQKQADVFHLVKAFLSAPQTRKDIQAQVIGIILLGHFKGESQVQSARRLLCAHIDPKRAPEIRRYALIALSGTIGEVPVRSDTMSAIEKCLCDPDWSNIAQQALAAFQRIEGYPHKVPQLLALLKSSPHYAVHMHVFERLSREDRPEVAKAIVPFLRDGRYRVREVAEQAVRSMNSAVEELFEILGDSDDADLCHRVHVVLKEYPQETKSRFLTKAITRFVHLFDRNDRRAQFFLDFVRSIDPEPLRQTIYDRVESFRRSKSKDRWLNISRYLQVLWDQHLITPEGRYVFAVALIRLNVKDLSPHARHANLGLQVIRSLIYDDAPGLVARLASNKDLAPEDLFYIGFHFMEEGGELRPFASALLQRIVEQFPRSKAAQLAQHKLALFAEREAQKAASKRSAKGRAAAGARARKPAAAPAAAAKPAAPNARPRAPRPAAPPAPAPKPAASPKSGHGQKPKPKPKPKPSARLPAAKPARPVVRGSKKKPAAARRK